MNLYNTVFDPDYWFYINDEDSLPTWWNNCDGAYKIANLKRIKYINLIRRHRFINVPSLCAAPLPVTPTTSHNESDTVINNLVTVHLVARLVLRAVIYGATAALQVDNTGGNVPENARSNRPRPPTSKPFGQVFVLT